MTAMISAKAETRKERYDRIEAEWINEAMAYLLALGIYAPDELEGANELAESLWDNSDNRCLIDEPDHFLSAKEAVDEELTYWGD